MAEVNTYKRSLGLFELVSLGVGGTIGSGIFVVPGIAARLSGPWSLLAWVIVAVSASCVLLSLATVSSRFTSSNSFYSLFRSVFGTRMALCLIILYLISSIFGISTIAAGIGQYITYFGFSNVLLIEAPCHRGFLLAQYYRYLSFRDYGKYPYNTQNYSSGNHISPAHTLYQYPEFRTTDPVQCHGSSRDNYHCVLAVYRF